MKKILFALSLLWSCSAWAAFPTFPSFTNTDFLVQPPMISLKHSQTGGTNIFINTTNFYDNSLTIYTNSTISVINSTVTFTNSSITINGTNVSTINPTIGRVPYNFDGTNFYDSALYFIDTNTVGADQVFTYDLGVTNLAAGGFVVSIPTVGGYGVLTNAPFGSFALWTNINHVYIPTDSSQIGLIANNVDSIQTLIAGGALMFSSYGTPQLSLGVNDLSNEFLGYMLLYSTTATPTDTQIRLSAGNGPGQLLILQNATNNAFELLNGDTLWDDATSAVYLPGGDWKPTAKGESIMLLHNTQGWAEIGRFGGPTNVVTQDLWQFAGGYLQPKTLTQPLFWTNSTTIGPGALNIVGFTNGVNYSRGATYHTGTNGAWVFDSQAAGSAGPAKGIQLDFGGTNLYSFGNDPLNPSLTIKSTTGQFAFSMIGTGANINSSGGFVAVNCNLETQGDVFPITDNTYSLGRNTTYGGWKDIWSRGTTYVLGMQETLAGDRSRLAISHTGTNGVIMLSSQSAGSAGAARPFQIDRNLFASVTTGDATFVDLFAPTQTNAVTGDISWLYATNGIAGAESTHTRMLRNGSGSDHTLTLPSTWHTNTASAIPATRIITITDGTRAKVFVSAIGGTSTAGEQDNVTVDVATYK